VKILGRKRLPRKLGVSPGVDNIQRERIHERQMHIPQRFHRHNPVQPFSS
jgi:hypothetical protein